MNPEIEELKKIQENFAVTKLNTAKNTPSYRKNINELKIKELEEICFREQLACEIILEIDAKTTEKSKELFEEKIKPTLQKIGIGYKCYDTHSKSLHVHIFFNQEIDNTDRKEWIEENFDGETIQILDKSYWTKKSQLIALEGAEHYKSKKTVNLIDSSPPTKNPFSIDETRKKKFKTILELKKVLKIKDLLENKYACTFDSSNQTKCIFEDHNDKKPSFRIYPETNSFYCFGCHKGGDIIKLIELKEKTSFLQAFKLLGGEIQEIKQKYYSPDGKNIIYSELSKAIQEKHKIITYRENEEMLYYTGGIYKPGVETLVAETAKRITGEELKLHQHKELLFQIQTETYRERTEPPTHLIHLSNGIYDLKKQEFLEFDEDIISEVQLPLKYNTEADCPKIKKFLGEILTEKDQKIVYELFGYCLLKAHPIQKAFMLVGDGANGKSTFLGLLKTFLGKENVASIALQDLEKNRFASAELHNKLANIYADLTDKAMSDTGKFKMLTGGDGITGEKKFGKPFNFVNFAKLFYSCNKLPETKDQSSAYFRRWIIMSFPNTFDGNNANPNILAEISSEDELSGLLNLGLEALYRVLEKKGFSGADTTEELQDKYERMSNSIKAFVMDCVRNDSDGELTKELFYLNYVNYCRFNNYPVKSKRSVGLELSQYITVIESHPKIDGKQVRAWKGIKFVFQTKTSDSGEVIELFKPNITNNTHITYFPIPNINLYKKNNYFEGVGDNIAEYGKDKLCVMRNIKERVLAKIQEKGELFEADFGGAVEQLRQALKELGHDGLVFECRPGHWKIVSKTKEEGGLVG